MFFKRLFGGKEKKDDEKKEVPKPAPQNQDGLRYPERDLTFKIVLPTPSDTGKTSIVLRYVDGYFPDYHIGAICVDFKIKTFNIRGGHTLKLQIWDYASAERFCTPTSSYYRRAKGVILCYDTTSSDNLDMIKKYKGEVERYSPEDVSVVIVGTKCDLPPNEETITQVGEYADSLGIPHMLCSSKKDIGVDDIFEKLIEMIGDKMEMKIEIEK